MYGHLFLCDICFHICWVVGRRRWPSEANSSKTETISERLHLFHVNVFLNWNCARKLFSKEHDLGYFWFRRALNFRQKIQSGDCKKKCRTSAWIASIDHRTSNIFLIYRFRSSIITTIWIQFWFVLNSFAHVVCSISFPLAKWVEI